MSYDKLLYTSTKLYLDGTQKYHLNDVVLATYVKIEELKNHQNFTLHNYAYIDLSNKLIKLRCQVIEKQIFASQHQK